MLRAVVVGLVDEGQPGARLGGLLRGLHVPGSMVEEVSLNRIAQANWL